MRLSINHHMNHRLLLIVSLLTVVLAAAALSLRGSGSHGAPLVATANAQAPQNTRVGFLDPSRATYLIVELGATDPHRGEFTALIPGLGALDASALGHPV